MNPATTALSRRRLLQAAPALLTAPLLAQEETTRFPLKGRLFKTLKIGMVAKAGSTLTEQFKAAKEAGFGAIELNCPGSNLEEVRKSIEESGLPVDGSVCAHQWQVRHSDPDPAVRAQALANLLGALRETKAVGGSTVLLVPGKGVDGPEEEIAARSLENISKALPLAAELGVFIAIENVWNQMNYDHDGGHHQTADRLASYVDAFNSPLVGMQFDIGNHWKYGNTGDWIRTLGKRILKLDVKGFSRQHDQFTKIGEGDLDFADVRNALTEINFYGWCAAEVAGGNLARLREISANMDRAFGLV